jgi:hypothetical protein
MAFSTLHKLYGIYGNINVNNEFKNTQLYAVVPIFKAQYNSSLDWENSRRQYKHQSRYTLGQE